MVSLLSFIKKAVVGGFIFAVTTMSVYSALMSSYQYVVPSGMGVCALRESHLELESFKKFNLIAKYFIFKLYTTIDVPECEFPLIPTRWINWLDTPAQTAIPFSKFAPFMARFSLASFLILGAVAVICVVACWVVYKVVWLVNTVILQVQCFLTYAQKFLSKIEVTALACSMIYAVWDGDHYIQETFQMVFVNNYQIYMGNLYLAIWLVLVWFFSIDGTVYRQLKKLNLFIYGLLVVEMNAFGFRLFMYHMLVGLALWYFPTEIAARERRQAEEKKVFQLVLVLICLLNDLIALDETIKERIMEIFQSAEDGRSTADQTKLMIKAMFRKLFLKYHPDRNSDPTATAQCQKLLEIHTAVTNLMEHPDVDLILEVVGATLLSVDNN